MIKNEGKKYNVNTY